MIDGRWPHNYIYLEMFELFVNNCNQPQHALLIEYLWLVIEYSLHNLKWNTDGNDLTDGVRVMPSTSRKLGWVGPSASAICHIWKCTIARWVTIFRKVGVFQLIRLVKYDSGHPQKFNHYLVVLVAIADSCLLLYCCWSIYHKELGAAGEL